MYSQLERQISSDNAPALWSHQTIYKKQTPSRTLQPVPGPSAHLQPPVRPQKPTQATHAEAHEYVGGRFYWEE